MFLEILLNDLKPNWKKMWVEILNESDIIEFLEKKFKKYDLTKNKIFPNKENIFQAFKYFDLHETKLVFLGQDPYIGSKIENGLEIPQATGLAFSVPDGFKHPPSLKNIFKEISNEYPNFKIPKSGNLERWAKEEKILLLNTALTVKKGMSNSHQKNWNSVINNVISYISINCDCVIFLLLGNNAKSKIKLIDKRKHKVITGIHPSPLSANKGFFGSDVFKRVNNELLNLGKNEIIW